MGSVKSKKLKLLAEELYNKYPDKFSNNFQLNKYFIDEIIECNKKMRNNLAGIIVNIHKNKNKNFEPVRKDF